MFLYHLLQGIETSNKVQRRLLCPVLGHLGHQNLPYSVQIYHAICCLRIKLTKKLLSASVFLDMEYVFPVANENVNRVNNSSC